jgi:hypothetical protein
MIAHLKLQAPPKETVMKRVLIALVCLALPCLSYAAPADSTSTGRANSLRAGAWALQFDINGQLFDVNAFAGGVSLKRQFSPRSALRFGVGTSGSSTTQDRSDSPVQQDFDRVGFYLESIFQRYANPGAAALFYWGVGPEVGWDHSKAEASSDSVRSTSEDDRWVAGGRALIGVEWFASKEISLHGEYTGSIEYSKTESTAEQVRVGQYSVKRKAETSGWSYGAGSTVRFGLSVYF